MVAVYRILKHWKGDVFGSEPLSSNALFHYLGFYSCIFMSYWSHFKTMLTDPGAVPSEAIPLDYYDEPPHTGKFENHHEICRYCDAYKPRTAHHCRVCERCVVRMDHHCPWANNCIGQTNHKFFLLFLLYTFIACIWALCLIISRTAACSSGYQYDPATKKYMHAIEWCEKHTGMDTLCMVLLGVEAFFFGMFTMCMICDQSTVLTTGQTQIDHHKLKRVLRKDEVKITTTSENLSLVFGGDGKPSIKWLIPIDVRWKQPERIFGFSLPKERSCSNHTPDDDSYNNNIMDRANEKNLNDLV